ncbi:unnamed protein product [Coregonus sp. 'balchen']|nr:unnamed protein product [Coregonus sp. 'balchen']
MYSTQPGEIRVLKVLQHTLLEWRKQDVGMLKQAAGFVELLTMMLQATLFRNAGSRTVRLSQSINDEERTYVTMRKTLIKKWLKDQDIDCKLEDVPNIALLGSGGGERAAVGMLGSLCQLAQDDLLDSLLYMCGVSGSTWCMSSLYSNPAESLSKSCVEIIKKLKGPTVDLSKAVEWLKLRKEQNQDFNLTDFWGAFTASYFMKEMNTCCLSEDAHRKIIKPYPIYSAIELDCHRQGYTKGVWFEMTPHESGFSGLGAFVPTSCLGSQFEGGTLREKRKEMDMVLLQGICGSAIADGQMNNAEVVKKIWGLFGGGKNVSNSGEDSMRLEFVSKGEVKVCNCLPSRVVRCVSELIEYAEDPDALKTWKVIATLEQLLKGHVSSKGEMLWNMDAERWQRTSLMERKKFIEKVSLELILTSDSWTKDWEDQSCTCNELWIVHTIFPLVIKWEWGTVSNFLFKIQDAGLKINSPYPPILRTSRKTVRSAKTYALLLEVPFPPVKQSVWEEKDHPEDCYVFEGKSPEVPTIMHMPLFNLQNCQDEEEIKKEREKYTTFHQHYDASEIQHIMEKAKDNLKNNKNRILEQIFMAVKRRKNRMSVAQ